MTTSILLAALLFPLQTGDAQGTGLLTVASESGEYSVAIPSKPNSRGIRTTGLGGVARVVARGCQTPSGTYLVERLEYPRGHIAGTEDSQLDTNRDELAREFGGKATGEKKIQLAGGSPGREFTIRGKPKGETGVVTTRVREYVVAKAVYDVIVSSPPDRDLPGDTDQFLGSLKVKCGLRPPPQQRAAGR